MPKGMMGGRSANRGSLTGKPSRGGKMSGTTKGSKGRNSLMPKKASGRSKKGSSGRGGVGGSMGYAGGR